MTLFNKSISLLSVFILTLWCCSSNDTQVTVVKPLSNLTDIQYGANKDTAGVTLPLMLDLYFPAGASTAKKYPLVMLIHGGSYISGDKGDMLGNSQILTDSGFVVASINYRMGWRAGVGDCDGDPVSQRQAAYRALQDSNAAMRFLVSNADNYGIDISWIFIGGNSAGSSLALNTSYIPEEVAAVLDPENHALLGPVNSASNTLTNTFAIKGICNMWGALPDSTLISPTRSIPMYSFHGTADPVVPYNYGHNQSCNNFPVIFGSYCLHRQLVRYNKPSIIDLYFGAGHGPNQFTHAFLMSNTACFFKKLIHGKSITSQAVKDLTNTCK